MTAGLQVRWAGPADLERLAAVMRLAIDRLQGAFLSAEQVVASRAVMGLDTRLVADGTYLIVEEDGMAVGCGGWSWRATLFGGDRSVVARDDARLDPARDPARIRAMYTHPDHARRGIGRLVLQRGEAAAAAAGFGAVELMSTLSGQPLYVACGYRPLGPFTAEIGGVTVPMVRMGKPLQPAREPA